MKRALVVVIAIMMIAAAGAFAQRTEGLAIGGEATISYSAAAPIPGGGMFLLHIPRFPLMMAIGVNSAPAIRLHADYWFAKSQGPSVLGAYVGVGAYLTLGLNPSSVSVGARLPLGVDVWPFREHLEFFLELAPSIGVRLVPTGFDWHLHGALGLRYWF